MNRNSSMPTKRREPEVPRANLRFNPTDNINLRLSYSSGFRAPQAFDEDLHVENVGGNVAMVELAKDLKEERSQSLSASADIYHRFGAFQINFFFLSVRSRVRRLRVFRFGAAFCSVHLHRHIQRKLLKTCQGRR